MDDDPVRRSAQNTVDAIDRQIAELTEARKILIKTFSLTFRIPEEVEKKTPSQWDEVRNRALLLLLNSGERMNRQELREQLGINAQQLVPVLKHPWFKFVGRELWLSEEGKQESIKQLAGTSNG